MGYNDDNEDLVAINQLLQTGSNIYKTAMNVDYNQKKLEATNNMANANLLAQMETNKTIGDAKVQKEFIEKELLNANQDIENLKTKMSYYDTNYMDWFDLDDKDKSIFGKEALDEIGVRYGENLSFSANIADDAETQLKNNKSLLELQYQIRDRLQQKYNDILSLQDDYLKVRDDGVYKGIREISEQKTYIAENPELFAIGSK